MRLGSRRWRECERVISIRRDVTIIRKTGCKDKALYKRFKAFGGGSIESLNPENPKVLAFTRRYQDENILVVANLSRLAQHAYLDLSRFEGCVPTELFGGTDFPAIGSAPYFLTLGPYGFYWFALQPQRAISGQPGAPLKAAITTLSLPAERQDLLSREARPVMEGVLLSYIRGHRWFGGKVRRIHGGEVLDVLPLTHGEAHSFLVLMEVRS